MSALRGIVLVLDMSDVWYRDGAGVEGLVRAALRYDPADPYTVALELRPVANHTSAPAVWEFARELLAPAVWKFARELLHEGLTGDTPVSGGGDVRLSPLCGHWLGVWLFPDVTDEACFARLPRVGVAAWLADTYRLVPAGDETDLLDLDHTIAQLLAPQ